MKKIVIALLAALMVGSTFLTACGGEPQSSATQNVEVSEEMLLQEIVGNFPSDDNIKVVRKYDEEYELNYAQIFVDGDKAALIVVSENKVLLELDMNDAFDGVITADQATTALTNGITAIVSTLTPSISEGDWQEIQDGAIQAIGDLEFYSKKIGDITYGITRDEDGRYFHFGAILPESLE